MSTHKLNIILLLWGLCLAFPPLSIAKEDADINRPIRVGIWDNAPLVFMDPDNGVKGLFPAIVDCVAKQEGWNIHYIHGVFWMLRKQLENNEIDMLLSVSVTGAREKIYLFNEEDIFTNWGVVLVAPDSKISSLLDCTEKTLSAMKDAVYTNAEGGIIDLINMFHLNATILEKPSYGKAMAAVRSGEADGAVVNRIVAERQGKKSNLVPSGIVFQPVETRIALNRNSPIASVIASAIDRHMRIMRKDPKSVYHEAMAIAQGKAESPAIRIDYSLIWEIVGACLIALILFFFWNRHLKVRVKKQTRALFESQEKYKDLYFNAQVGLCRTTIEDGRILECNDKLAQMAGYKNREECIGQHVTSEHYAESNVRTDILKVLLDKGYIENYPVLMTKVDGTTAWSEFSAKAYPEKGYIEVVTVDTNKEKLALKDLKESEERLQIIFDNAPAVMLLLNEHSEIMKINRAGQEYAGKPESELIHSHGGDVLNCVVAFQNQKGCGFSEKCNDCGIRKTVEGTFETNKEFTKIEVEFLQKIGNKTQKRSLLLSTSIVRITSPKIVLVTLDDITELKNMERQLRQTHKMEAIGTLAGGIAHDFNNILSSVIGYTEIVLDDELPSDAPARNSLQNVLKAGLRAKDLVKQILAFSRQTQYEKKPISLGIIIKEVLKLIRASLPTNIDIRQDISAGSSTILGDPVQIHQVMMNLCTNAGYAMRLNGGTLDVSLTAVEYNPDDRELPEDLKPGAYVQIIVTDTGPGMAPSVMEQIFNPFFTTKPKEEGTGLGLSVAHGIIKEHNGSIQVDSQPGEGTTFSVFLPLLAEEKSGDDTTDERLPSGHERILVVDDEKEIGDALQRMLQGLGYAVTTSNSSHAALRIFSESPTMFDLIITDQTMPKMTGDQLAVKVLAVKPDMPVILCTGFSHVVDEKQAKSMGIRDFITKPLIRKDLAVAVRRVLDQVQGKQDNGEDTDHR